MSAKPQSPRLSVMFGSEAMGALLELQTLSLAGPPSTRENRLKRQGLASKLSLSPDLYNHLVFGESTLSDNAPHDPVPTPLPSPSGDTTITPNVMAHSVRRSNKYKESLRPETNVAETPGLAYWK